MKRLPPAVVALGLASFFTDASSEMIFPLLPAFLVGLGATPTFLGLVEGAAELVSSLLKLVSGQLSDRAGRRKPLVLAGYSVATFVRPLVGLAAAPWHVLAVRVVDRVGKGIRTSPRDALLAASAAPGEAGRAFGFHRAMDHLGAVVGPLIATVLLAVGLQLRSVFALALVPGVLALAAILTVREPPRAPTESAAGGGALPRSLRTYLAILALFSLGNATDAFLLLRAQELGTPVTWIPVLWTVFHLSKVGSSMVGGSWSDRVPRVRLIAAGWVVYAFTYVGFALAERAWQTWALFAIYGLYHGLTEPAEKALVKDLAPAEARGRAYGWYNFTIGICAVPAGLTTGMLWERHGPGVALGLGAALAAVAAVALLGWNRREERMSRVA